MKISLKILSVLMALVLLTSGCGLIQSAGGPRIITPSNVVISENRDVSGFSGIQFTTFGKVNIIQGDKESVNISGPDNVLPEITTTVNNETLVIKTKTNISITTLSSANMLTFTIVVKELTSLDISGAGDVQVETLSTPSMNINLSGAGRLVQNQLTTDNLTINLSGLGGIDITGKATQATIDIPGAGSINAPDLQIQKANVTISGLGSATLWVTDELTGDISGAGSVSYYGSPQAHTNTSGLGKFNALGNK